MMVNVSNQRAPQYTKRKTADESVAASTTLQDDDHLTFPIAANETWVCEWTLHTAFVAAAGIKVAVNGPSGATIRTSASITPNGIVPAFGSTTTLGAAIALAPALADGGIVKVHATITASSTPGTVALRFAQNTSDAGNTTVLAGSILQAVKL